MHIWKILFWCVITGSFYGCSSVNQSKIESREFISSLSDSTTKITVILPISGRHAELGKAVRDGFLAAYYIDPEDYACEINFVDSSAHNVSDLYREAVNNGSKIIIGPLLKHEVSELMNIPLAVPVFALNNSENGTLNKYDNLYQFGLIPEEESKQMATKLLQDGVDSCLIIAPQNNNLNRSIEAFSEHYTKNGGKISAVLRYTKNQLTLPKQICTFLSDEEDNLCKYNPRSEKSDPSTQSEAENAENNAAKISLPPLRHDFAGIVIFTNPTEARQLIPLLNFNFAGNFPIYANSTVFDPTKNKLFNQDLDGIKFSTIPWLIKSYKWKNDILKQLQNQLSGETAKNKPQIQRLYALGIDAYLVMTRLNELASNLAIEGTTGTITLDNNQYLYHKLIWMQMKHGEPRPLEHASDASH